MRIYLSGPISGHDDFMKEFQRKAAGLSTFGCSVINPANLSHCMPPDTSHEEYMKLSFCMIEMADIVCMCPGWESSRGANQEYGYALAKGKVIKEFWDLVNWLRGINIKKEIEK